MGLSYSAWLQQHERHQNQLDETIDHMQPSQATTSSNDPAWHSTITKKKETDDLQAPTFLCRCREISILKFSLHLRRQFLLPSLDNPSGYACITV